MKYFSDIPFLTESKNTHMTHLEDVVLYRGVNGTRDAINTLRAIRDVLADKGESPNISVKWDGAPSIVAGQEPGTGDFFVAKKSVFNKTPKVYKTPADVKADIPEGDLRNKMLVALKYLPSTGIKGILQGDLMFTKDTVKGEDIDGEKYVTFHPNTILYAIPFDTPEGRRIRKAKIGVVWHTSYVGDSFENMRATFGVKHDSFTPTRNVWARKANIDIRSTAFSAEDTKELNQALSQVGKMFNQVKGDTMRHLEQNKDIAILIESYHNSQVRAGSIEGNIGAYVNGLIEFVNRKYDKEVEKRKSDKGKAAQNAKRKEVLDFFSGEHRESLMALFYLHRYLHEAKMIVINKLNKLSTLGHFVKTKNGYRLTAPEGFVAVDRKGSAVKLVDRLEFSANNFSDEILKGWQR